MATSKRNADALEGNRLKAIDLLGDTVLDMFALEDVGRHFAALPVGVLSAIYIVQALTSQIAERLNETAELLPKGGDAFNAACDASEVLERLDEFTGMANTDDRWNISIDIVGMVVLELTIRAAKAIDRACIACGHYGIFEDTSFFRNPHPQRAGVPHATEVVHG